MLLVTQNKPPGLVSSEYKPKAEKSLKITQGKKLHFHEAFKETNNARDGSEELIADTFIRGMMLQGTEVNSVMTREAGHLPAANSSGEAPATVACHL